MAAVAPSYATKCEFIRYIYRRAASESITRSAVLDALADEHVGQDLDGKRLVGSSASGVSVSFQASAGSSPAYSLELIAWARGYISETDVEDSVALIAPPVRYLSTSFAGVRG